MLPLRGEGLWHHLTVLKQFLLEFQRMMLTFQEMEDLHDANLHETDQSCCLFFPLSKFSRFQLEDLLHDFRKAGICSCCEPCYFLNTVKSYVKPIPKLQLSEFSNGFSGF